MTTLFKKIIRSGKYRTRRYYNIFLRSSFGTITHVDTIDSVAALTFDDGPNPKYTPRLLDVLRKYNAQATFFMLGVSINSNPDLVKRAVDEGHYVGNHTWDHPAVPLLSRRQRVKQIKDCRYVLPKQPVRLFRPPYGYIDFSSRLDAQLLGYNIIGWNRVVYDWLDYDSEHLLSYFKNSISPGCIILMHDALYHQIKPHYMFREPLIEALELFLKQYTREYQFVTIPELLRYGKPVKEYKNPEVNISWLNALHGESVYRYNKDGNGKINNVLIQQKKEYIA